MKAALGTLVLLATLLVAACGGGGDTTTPVSDDGSPLFDGRSASEFFRSNCSSCHGQQRQGAIGPALTPDVLTEDDTFYFDAIAHGRVGTAMPAWRRADMTDREIEALIESLRAEQ